MSFAAQILTRRSLRRRHILGLGLILVVLIWGGLWGGAAYRLNAMVDELVEDSSKTKAFSLRFGDRSTDGTPLAVHVHLENFQARLGTEHDVSADEAVLYLGLLGNRSLSIKLKNNVTGRIKGRPFDVNFLKFGYDLPSRKATTDTQTGLSCWLIATALNIHSENPLPLSDQIASLDLEMRVMGAPPDFSDPQSVKVWNDASGVLEFDRFNAKWGPLNIAAKGTIGLTPDLQPEGAFSGRIDGLNEALDQLVMDGLIEKRQQTLLRSSLDVLTRPALGNADTPIVPVTIQSNALYLGPVRLMSIPRLNWDDAAPSAEEKQSEPPTDE